MKRIVGIAVGSLFACFTVVACGAADGDLGQSQSALRVGGDPTGDPPPDDPTPVDKPVSYPVGGKCKVLMGVNKGMVGTYDKNGYCCNNNNCTYCPRSSCQTLLTGGNPVSNPGDPPPNSPGPFEP